MATINAIEQSTYRMCYKGELPSLPFIKYKNLPCMYMKTSPSDRSFKPIPLTRGKKPVQQVFKITSDPLVKLTAARPKSSKKHAVSSNKVFETKFGPMDSATVDALYHKWRYSTFTQKAAEECALPVSRPEPPKTTQEPKADMVRLHGQRYEETPDAWQDAVLWDRIQSRVHTQGCGNSMSDKTLPMPPSDKKLLQKRQAVNSMNRQKQEKITHLVQNDGLANVFVMKCPGYAGYIPLCPPETRLDDKKSTRKTSLMTSSYSKFPDTVYKKPVHAKMGPFSKTVTLTSPLNPYNKIGQETVKVETESRYINMKDYLNVLPY